MSCKGGNCTCGKGDHAQVQEQVFLSQIDHNRTMFSSGQMNLGLNNLNLDPEIIEVRFKNQHKDFYINNKMLQLKAGDMVLTEAEGGTDLGTVSNTGQHAKKLYAKKSTKNDPIALKGIIALATEKELNTWLEARKADRIFLEKSRKIASVVSKDLSILDSVVRADFKQVSIYFTANGKVDPGQLLNRLINELEIKINLYQVSKNADSGDASKAFIYTIEDPKQGYKEFTQN